MIEAFDPRPLVERSVGVLRALGVAAGERVVTLLDNDVAAFAFGVACALEGVVEVPVPSGLPSRDVAEVVADAEPVVAVLSPGAGIAPDALDATLAAVPAARPSGRVAVLDRLLDAARPTEPAAWWPVTRPMAYTSGTTGRRKGVFVGVHDAAWGEAWIRDELETFGDRHGDVHLVVSPLYHSGPFRHALVTTLTADAPRVAVMPAFDGARFRAALRTVRPTSLFCVPTHLHRLLAAGATRDDLASLRLLVHAGAPCPTATKEAVLALAPAGATWEFYGSTEGQFTACPPDTWRAAPGTVGTARPGCRLEVRDDDGKVLSPGEVGTVWNQAPPHARWRYWRAPERTAAAWDGDAFTVDDLGVLDEHGRLTLAGRPGDLVISGGVNVYPAEVERVLLEHDAVAEAVVTGVDDPDWGRRVVAAVVCWPGATVTATSLRDWSRERLAPARVPKEVRVVDELPRTPTGKVRRVGLADALGFA